ncbi:PPC domain-containing protein [Myxococcota bacterium]
MTNRTAKHYLLSAIAVLILALSALGCGDECTNECGQEGGYSCEGNILYRCGDFDSDSCLEWGDKYDCPGVCNVDRCVSGCQDECPEGTRRCSGTNFQICSRGADGCTHWGNPQACPAGETCTGDGSCTSACTHKCQTGQSQCVAGQNQYQDCVCPAEGCCDWGIPVNCPAGQSCVNGACATCQNDCFPSGKRECVGTNGYRVCGNLDADDCLEWGDVTQCTGGQVCYNGNCGPACTDQCTRQGEKQCTTDERGYVTCGNYDADPCLEWGAEAACAPTEKCQDGVCVFNCVNECAVEEKRCAGSGYQTCGNFDQDPCVEWSVVTDCKHNETCSNGVCSAVCEEECAQGERSCSGFTSYVECGQFDHDQCWDWGPATRCALWERCLDGDCTIMCIDECDPAGTQQCAGDGYQVCGDYDWDACLEWGDVIDCAFGELCSNGQCTTLPCEDDTGCTQEGLQECISEIGFHVCGQYDSDICLDWGQVVNCGADERCTNGECLEFCQDQCNQGEVGCVNTGTRWVCNDENGDGCLDQVPLDCATGETCNQGTCAVVCADDSYEENDDSSSPATVSGSVSGLVICENDDDWYRIVVGANQGLKVTIHFLHSAGDLDMKLFKESDPATAIDTSAGIADTETVTAPIDANGEVYLVRVYGFSGAANNYDMNVEIVSQGDCLDDSFEENDSQAEAQFVLDELYEDLMYCQQDEDWYVNWMFAGEDLKVLIAFTHADGDLDIEIIDDQGAVLADSTSTSDDEYVEALNVLEGTHYIRVYGAAAAVENAYEMLIEYGAPCVDDQYEENDTDADATAWENMTTTTGLMLCGGDEDWYSVTVGAGETLSASILFTHGQNADLDLYLYDPSGAEVDYSMSTSDNEDVEEMGTVAGTYNIRVSGWRNSENTYELQVTH